MKVFDTISIAALLHLAVILSITFFQSLKSNGLIEVNVGSIGETSFEAAILIIVLICGVVTLGRTIRRLV